MVSVAKPDNQKSFISWRFKWLYKNAHALNRFHLSGDWNIGTNPCDINHFVIVASSRPCHR